MEKECGDCKRVRHIQFFGINNGRPDGHAYRCIDCAREKAKQYPSEGARIVKKLGPGSRNFSL